MPEALRPRCEAFFGNARETGWIHSNEGVVPPLAPCHSARALLLGDARMISPMLALTGRDRRHQRIHQRYVPAGGDPDKEASQGRAILPRYVGCASFRAMHRCRHLPTGSRSRHSSTFAPNIPVPSRSVTMCAGLRNRVRSGFCQGRTGSRSM